MGRDLRNIGFNKNEYCDRCVFYGANVVNGNSIEKDAKPLGRFYKKDVEPFAWKYMSLGNGQVSSSVVFEGKIETLDHVENLRPDMYVVDQTGMLFLVVPPVVSDDIAKTKVMNRRPMIATTITLRGVEITEEPENDE